MGKIYITKFSFLIEILKNIIFYYYLTIIRDIKKAIIKRILAFILFSILIIININFIT